MKLVKNFFLVVLLMIVELSVGFFDRSPNFYDKHTMTKTRLGYVVFVTLAAFVTFGVITWMYNRIY
ncbi:hypothetical protein ABES25_04905 [Bacillus gobiensis]